MIYTITGDETKGFVIKFSNGKMCHVCPCCAKPLPDRGKAILLAENILACNPVQQSALFATMPKV